MQIANVICLVEIILSSSFMDNPCIIIPQYFLETIIHISLWVKKKRHESFLNKDK